jgi:long-subunit fatty acid transport protein
VGLADGGALTIGGMMKRTATCLLAAIMIAAGASDAAANPEYPALYDARSLAMGGTGVAFAEDGAAVFHNPANLAGIDLFAVSLSASPMFAKQSAPLTAPNTETSSARGLAPLFLVGGGVRVSRRIVVGLGAYVRSGGGALYEDVGGAEEQKLSMSSMELAIPVAIRLTDEINAGLAVRWGYAALDAALVVPDMSGSPMNMEQEVSGFGQVPGVTAGVQYRPISQLRLGLVYRSRMDLGMDGTTTITPPGSPGLEADTETEFVIAHAFHFGGAYSLLSDKLLVAADVSVRLFGNANETMTFTNEAGGMMTTQENRLGWENVFTAHLGGEYRLSDLVGLRLGYSLSPSATADDAASAFSPPPGVMHGATAGAGVRAGNTEIDAGAMYTFFGADIDETDNGLPGRYEGDLWVIGLSATYRR